VEGAEGPVALQLLWGSVTWVLKLPRQDAVSAVPCAGQILFWGGD
jgi:hypothetical protein